MTDPHHGISKQPCWHHPCCVSVGWGLLDFMSASSPLPPPPSSSSSSASLSPLYCDHLPRACVQILNDCQAHAHNSQWPCEEPRPAVSILTFFLAFCLNSFCHIFWHFFWLPDIISNIFLDILSDILMTYLLTFFLTNFWHSFWHMFWHLFWHSVWHIFWHSFWHIFSHSVWHSFCRLRSGREHWTPMVAVEVWQGTLDVAACGWGERGWREEEDEEDEEEQAEEEAEEDEEDGEEQAEEEAEEEQADIKSNNPHLTGGKRPKTPLSKAKMIAVWLNEATPKPKYVQQWPTHCICKNVKKMALSPQRVRLLTPGHPSEAGLESNWWPLSQANARGHWIGAFSERKCLSSSSWS